MDRANESDAGVMVACEHFHHVAKRAWNDTWAFDDFGKGRWEAFCMTPRRVYFSVSMRPASMVWSFAGIATWLLYQ